MRWLPERKTPYSVKAHWYGLGLYGTSILIMSYGLGSFASTQPYRSAHPVMVSCVIVILGLTLWFFLLGLLRRTVFDEQEITYYLFPIHREYRYEDLQNIRRANNYSRNVRFSFKDGRSFVITMAFYDADYLIELLRTKSSCDLAELEKFRDIFTPRIPRRTAA